MLNTVQANLEKEKAALTSASNSTDVEATVAQRVAAATAQLQSEKHAAVAAAIAPLQQQLSNLASGQPNVAQLQQQHAAEIQTLQEELAKRPEGLPQNLELETVIQTRVAEQIVAVQEEHSKALAQATENGRREADAKFKMLNMQFNRVKAELAHLKGGGPPKPVAAPPAGGVSAATNVTSPGMNVPPPIKTEPSISPAVTLPAVPAATAGLPASPLATRGRGRGAGVPRGGPPVRGRGAAPAAGTGRGTVLDAVNQAIGGGAPASPSGQLSILGASGQKRARDEDDSTDPGALAKRLKPGEGGLPTKPAGRGGTPTRNRLPGSPAPGP